MNSRMIRVRLDEVLKARGWTLYHLAKETGIPYNTLSRWRHDKLASYDKDVLNRLCEVLACQPGEILTWSP
jgi:putative transcriptional regulator